VQRSLPNLSIAILVALLLGMAAFLTASARGADRSASAISLHRIAEHAQAHHEASPGEKAWEDAAASQPTAEVAPAPIFSGDFERSSDGGFAGWELLQALPGRTRLVSGSAFQGSSDARFEVREGDIEPETGSERTEVTGPTFQEGADLYIGDAIRVPSASTFEGPWQLVQQLHNFGEGYNGSPGMAVFLENPVTLRLGPGDGSHTFWRSSQLENNRWYYLVYHVKLSRNPSEGFAEVWLNGVQQTLSDGSLREYGPTMETAEAYLKAGIYRSQFSTGTSIVEHDDIAVGTSLPSVLPGEPSADRGARRATN
jgi:hypothetical protein